LRHCKLTQSFGALTLLKIIVLSANLKIQFLMPYSRSFIYMKNNIGHNTEPCGTPLRTAIQLEKLSRITTCCFLSCNHCIIQFRRRPLMSRLSRFTASLLCETLLKAIAKSKKTTSTLSRGFLGLR